MKFLIVLAVTLFAADIFQGTSGYDENQYGTSIINWNQCSFLNMNDQRDHGVIRECVFYKLSDATSLRLTWSGDIRLHGCTGCCMRWHFTVNGLECDSTVDGQVYQAQNLNIHRISTITGYCRHVSGLPLLQGQHKIQFNVGNCPFTSNLYDAYTGHHSNSRIIIEEIAPARPSPSLPLPKPPTYIYEPNWRQCTWSAKNDGRDYGDFGHCSFTKQRDDTWLKVSYHGDIRVVHRDSGRWFFRIDGAECTVPDSIDAQLYHSSGFNNHRPAAITGYCQSAGGLRIRKGMHNIILSISRVVGRDLYTCWNSVCRIVVEEVPPPANAFPDAGGTCGGTGSGASCVFPFSYKGKSYSQCTTVEREQSWCATQGGDVGSHNKWGYCICNKKIGTNNAAAYMPQWEQYTWKSLNSGIDNGVVREIIFIKKSGQTSLRVSWHGDIRIQGCTNCCRRWFFTIDGEECSSPQPIDAAVYQSNNINLHRPATVGGICESKLENGAYSIAAGTQRIQFRVGQCPGYGPVFDASTGWIYVSRIVVEELPTPKPVRPPKSIGFVPNYKQCAFHSLNKGEDQGVIIQCPFVKRETGSYLRLTYEGDIRLNGCSECCMRWYFTVDGAECSVPATIDAVVYITGNVNHHRPGTVSGLCGGLGAGGSLKKGERNVQFRVGKCNAFGLFDASTCWNSACRVIVEEVPPPQ